MRPEDYDEAVYDVVEAIPRGYVLTYGDIAELLGSHGPRRVAQAMSRSAGAVPWHRVIRADGTPAPAVAVRQLELLRGEATPMVRGRVDLAQARWPNPVLLPQGGLNQARTPSALGHGTAAAALSAYVAADVNPDPDADLSR